MQQVRAHLGLIATLGRIGVLACTATCPPLLWRRWKRDVYGWRFGSRQRTGEDAYTPSLATSSKQVNIS
jgi:hypothetical protein